MILKRCYVIPRTFGHFRASWMPGIPDRQTRPVWEKKRGLSMGSRARQWVKILRTAHRPRALAPAVESRFETLLQNAAERK